jgi:hypothetical protein
VLQQQEFPFIQSFEAVIERGYDGGVKRDRVVDDSGWTWQFGQLEASSHVGVTQMGTMQGTEERSVRAEKQLSWNLRRRKVPLMLLWTGSSQRCDSDQEQCCLETHVSSPCVENNVVIQTMCQAERSTMVRCVLWLREGLLGSGGHA